MGFVALDECLGGFRPSCVGVDLLRVMQLKLKQLQEMELLSVVQNNGVRNEEDNFRIL